MRPITVVLVALALMGATVTPVSAAPPDRQTSDVLAFADLSDVGDARLARNDTGIQVKVKATRIPTGVYTLWWVVWNTPEGCATTYACGEADLFDPEGDTGLAIGYGGGALVGPGGKLMLASALREEEALTGFPYTEFGAIGVSLPDTTLVDSRHAEIHLVLRSHEEPIPGLVHTQLRSFNGGCVYDPPINGSEPAYGIPGPNTCTDRYFVVFPSMDTPRADGS